MHIEIAMGWVGLHNILITDLKSICNLNPP